MQTPRKIPSKDLNLQNRLLADQLEAAFRRVAYQDKATLGRELREFEKEFAAWIGVAHARGVANGTDALILALEALDIGPGDEVIVPANTYGASVLAVVRVGATPRLVDPDPGDHLLHPEAVEQALTPRTRAIMPVHLYGLPVAMERLEELARERGILIIEDAAQAHGAAVNGKRCGAFGAISCFSFHPSKNLGAIGDGGAVVTQSAELDARLGRLRDFGKSGKYEWAEPGHNSKLNTLQAAFLRVKLSQVDAWNRRRRALAHRYTQQLADTGLILPREPDDGRVHCWHLYVVRVPHGKRDALQAAMADHGVRCGIHYPVPPHLQPAFAAQGWRPGQFPVAEELAAQVLTLPLYPELSDTQQERVIELLREVCHARL